MGEVGCLRDGNFQNLEVGGVGTITSLTVSNVNVVPDLSVVKQSGNTGAEDLVKNSLYIMTVASSSAAANVWTLPALASTDAGAIIEVYCPIDAGNGTNKLIISVHADDADVTSMYGTILLYQPAIATVASATAAIGASTQSALISVDKTPGTPGADTITLDGGGSNSGQDKPGAAGTRLRFTNRNKQIWWVEGVIVLDGGQINTVSNSLGALFG